MPEANQDQAEPKRADFKQTNPSDNPVDNEGKTAKQREVEAAQDKQAADGKGEFEFTDEQKRKRAEGRQSAGQSGSFADPRHQGVNPDSVRPPVPGVDRFHGGSSLGGSGAGAQGGSAPDQHQHPLPNPNNPNEPNNPDSHAHYTGQRSAGQVPRPEGARTTSETPMSGSSPAQREHDRRADADEQRERNTQGERDKERSNPTGR